MYLPTRTHRVLIMGRNGAVGANHPLATQAGLDTLRAGGNAVDASVAISLALSVVEPGMSGLGGDGFYQVHIAADARSRKVFLGNLDIGVPALAALIRQPDLARTLEEIAQEGAETFYRGRLAKRLAAGMREVGVLVDERDLEACQPQVQAPIGIAYRGFRVTQTPPNSTGFTMLQMLKIAERFDIAALDPVQRIHVLVEAKKRAFQDRERYGTDPRFGDVPLDRLLSDA